MNNENAAAIKSIIESAKKEARKEPGQISQRWFIAHVFLTFLMIDFVVLAHALGVPISKPVWVIAALFLINFMLYVWYAMSAYGMSDLEKKHENPDKK